MNDTDLMSILFLLLFALAFVAITVYLLTLNRFLRLLKENANAKWHELGQPALAGDPTSMMQAIGFVLSPRIHDLPVGITQVAKRVRLYFLLASCLGASALVAGLTSSFLIGR